MVPIQLASLNCELNKLRNSNNFLWKPQNETLRLVAVVAEAPSFFIFPFRSRPSFANKNVCCEFLSHKSQNGAYFISSKENLAKKKTDQTSPVARGPRESIKILS